MIFPFFRPDIRWYRNDEELSESPRYLFFRAIQPSNPNIHFVRLTIVVSINYFFKKEFFYASFDTFWVKIGCSKGKLVRKVFFWCREIKKIKFQGSEPIELK